MSVCVFIWCICVWCVVNVHCVYLVFTSVCFVYMFKVCLYVVLFVYMCMSSCMWCVVLCVCTCGVYMYGHVCMYVCI